MAEQYPRAHANNSSDMPPDQNSKEPGCFDFMKKKEQKCDQEDLVMTDLNAAKGNQEEKHTLMDELQRTHSNSSSSSEEEVEEGGERKKKGLKEAIEEKISGDIEGENTKQTETCIPMDKCSSEEEKKGFLENQKIKEKLPGQHKKDEEDTQTPPACEQYSPGITADAREKKGIIDKIKEKLPGHHKTNENDEVEN